MLALTCSSESNSVAPVLNQQQQVFRIDRVRHINVFHAAIAGSPVRNNHQQIVDQFSRITSISEDS